MKNKLIHGVRGFVIGAVLALSLVALPSLAYAGDALTCEGVQKISIEIKDPTKTNSIMQNYLNNFANYEVKGVYKLCFEIKKGSLSLNAGLTFSADKPALISGLELQRDSSATKDFSLLTINSTSPVMLRDINVKGSGDDDNGACLALTGSGHKVINSEFSFCDTGILVEADEVQLGPKDPNLKAMNSIHDNHVGLYVVKGTENRFAYNSIFDNTIDPMKKGTPDDGILMDTGTMLPELWRPEVVVDKNTSKPIVCTRDNAGNVVSRLVKFKVKESGDIVIYQARALNQQGEKYLTKCTVDITKCTAEKVCNCNLTAFMKSKGIADDKCGDPNLKVIALFDSPTEATTYTTTYTKEEFVLDGQFDIPAVPVILPGGGSGMDGAATSSDAGTGESGGAASDYLTNVDGGTVTLGEGSGGSVVASSAGGQSPTKVGCSLSPQGRLPAGRQGMPLDWSMGFWWIVWLGMPLVIRGISKVR